jgi:hypothetical protein
VAPDYRRLLDHEIGASIQVEFAIEQREVVNYSVVLIVEDKGGLHTVRVYDGAHGVNEMHRYTDRGGKQAAEIFHAGTLGEGMRAAIIEIENGYAAMIEAWHQR